MRTVAALFVRADSIYKTMPGVDAWDIERDARKWPGGCPVVAHPPCRTWSRARAFVANPRPGERDLAPWAVKQVQKWGGVLEHPKESALWDACGLPVPGAGRDEFGGWTLPVLQMWWGHRAEKATLLYIVGCEPASVPDIPLKLGDAERVLFNRRGLRAGMPGFRTECHRAEREHSPPEFAAWLLELARRTALPVSHNMPERCLPGGRSRSAAAESSQTELEA